MLFSLVREDLIGQQTTVHVPEAYGSRRRVPVPLNVPTPDGTVQNNVALVNAKVVLSDVPSTPAFRAQQLQVLSEVVKSLPPEMQMATIDVLIKLTDVPEKDLLIERLRRMAGIQDIPPEMEDQVRAAQEAAAQEANDLAKAGQVAAIKLNEAKAENLMAETEKTLREAGLIEAQLQAQINELGTTPDNPEDTELREMLADAIQEIQSLQLRVQEKRTQLEQDADLKKYAIDKKHQVDAARAADTHVEKMAAIKNAPKPVKKPKAKKNG